jgi:GH25 family lysozyme M1 (1,4-beta-N-acetylmuramidase)
MTPIEKLISIAEREVGYCEKSVDAVRKNPSVLDEKTDGAGADNMTKYSRNLLNWVGAPYAQGVAWCDMWVDFCFITAFGTTKAKEMIGGWSAYTPTSAQYYKNMGRWFTKPQIGDQIFFKNATRICHTGIVYKIDATTVYTIEGNTSNKAGVVPNGGCVAKKSYLLTNSSIAGYGRPKYELVANDKTYLYKGIDVSAYQKNIDYNSFKNAKVDFAILKIVRKDLNKDLMFEKHYEGFTKAGIPIFCVYQYSYATTVEKARNDARTVIKHLEGRRLAVCLDIEDDAQKRLGRALIDIINAYQEVIEAAGLPFLLYTGMSFYNTYIKPYESGLKCKDIWMARYYKSYTPMTFAEDPSNNYKPMANLVGWQYTSSGQLPGYNGNLDFNIIYRDIKAPAVVSQNITTKVTTKGSKLNVRKAPKTGAIVGKLENGKVIKIMDVRDGWLVIGPEQYVSAMYVSTNTYGTIIANALNIRSSDSTNGSIVGRYIKDEVVPILAQSSTGWYLTPKGWISNNYTKI